MRICANWSSPFCNRSLHPDQEAESGERAWNVLREFNPDVIILDWMMEGMSGLDLVKMIRTSPQSPNPFVPVIMLTGHTHLNQVREARDGGINEFIAKPVSVRTMMQRLASVIENPVPRPHQGLFRALPPPPRVAEYSGPERRAADGSAVQAAE